MSVSLETFGESPHKLNHKFDADKTHYLLKDYSDAQARIEFINPLFKALGWDVENDSELTHQECEPLRRGGPAEQRMKSQRPDAHRRLTVLAETTEQTAFCEISDFMRTDELVYELCGITDEERRIIEAR